MNRRSRKMILPKPQDVEKGARVSIDGSNIERTAGDVDAFHFDVDDV